MGQVKEAECCSDAKFKSPLSHLFINIHDPTITSFAADSDPSQSIQVFPSKCHDRIGDYKNYKQTSSYPKQLS
jgi:hypothetical protein